MKNYSKYLVCFELNDNASDNSDAKNANAKQVLSSAYYYKVLVLKCILYATRVAKPNLVEKKYFAFLFFYRKHKCQPLDSVTRNQWTVTRG